MRTRFYVTYDVNDPSDSDICEVLTGLGRRRSEIVRALILHTAKRYGWDVLRKKNLDVLLYLLREEESRSFQAYCPYSGRRSLSSENEEHGEKENTVPLKRDVLVLAQPVNTPIIPEASDRTSSESLVQQIPASVTSPPDVQDSENADRIRRSFVDFLQNGFYEQEQ